MKKQILVTGATDGIGKKTAQRLFELGHDVIVHGRSAQRVQAAIQEIKSSTKSQAKLESSVFDLSSMKEVVKGADDLKKRFGHLDVLLNNAGTYQLQRKESPEGIELTMAINHFGPTLLTYLLKPLLQKANEPRVVLVSSIAHNRGQIVPGNYNYEKSYGAYEAYATSKLANVTTARHLAKDWASDKISVYSLHPGVITTKLLKIGFNTEGDSVERGSDTSVYLAHESLAPTLNGEYFVDCRPTPISQKAKNLEEVQPFWDWTMKVLGPYLG